MHGIGLAQGVKVIPLADDGVVDTQGFEGVVFVCTFGSASASNEMQGTYSDDAGGTGKSDTGVVTDMDGTATVGILEIHKPRKRFVGCDLTGTGTMVAVLYGARKVKTVQDSTTIAQSNVSPAV
jgi:hypothetical protein